MLRAGVGGRATRTHPVGVTSAIPWCASCKEPPHGPAVSISSRPSCVSLPVPSLRPSAEQTLWLNPTSTQLARLGDRRVLGMHEVAPTCTGGLGGHLGSPFLADLHLSMGGTGMCLGLLHTWPGLAPLHPPAPCGRSPGAGLSLPGGQPGGARGGLTSGRPRRRGSPRWPAAACAGAGSCTRPGPAPGPHRSGSAAPATQKGGH